MTLLQSQYGNPADIAEANERKAIREKTKVVETYDPQSCGKCIHKSQFFEVEMCAINLLVTRMLVMKRCDSHKEA